MAKIYHTVDEYDERSYEENMLEKAFREGCEHGYRRAMKSFNERSSLNYREGFEEKMERLKEKYR